MENSLEGDTWEDQEWNHEGLLVAVKYKWMEETSRGEEHLKAKYRKGQGPKRAMGPLKKKKNLQGIWKIKVNMSMLSWLNAPDDGNQKHSEKNMSQCHSVYHKSHIKWPAIDSAT